MSNHKLKISETLIIAIVPLIGYILAFSYESGYAKAFEIPSYLISISLIQILIATGALLSLFLTFLLLFNLIYLLIASFNIHAEIIQSLSRIIPSFVIFALLLLIHKTQWKEWIILLALFVILAFFEFIFPLITQRKIKGYTDKLEAQSKIEEKIPDIYSKISYIVGRGFYNIFFILIMLYFIAFSIGRGKALQQKEFLTYKDNPTIIVLRIYDNLVVSKTYDSSTKTINAELILQNISEQKINLIKKRIGPLKTKNP